MKWLQHELAICAACLTTFISCSQLNINVGAEDDSSASSNSLNVDNESEKAMLAAPSWNSLEDSLAYLKELREKAPELLINRYREGGRDFIRKVFRQFRDAISKEAVSTVDFAPWRSLSSETCLDTNEIDLFGLREIGDLRALLENSYIGRLKPQQAELFNPQLPERLDEISRLALFEFGISIQGQSNFAQVGDDYSMSSDLRWKVIHEEGDDMSLWLNDDNGVKFSMTRQFLAGKSDALRLEATVGKGVYEDNVTTALPSMSLQYEKSLESVEGRQYQTLELMRGLKNTDGTWKDLFLSRRVELYYSQSDETILELIDTDQWQMPGEQVRKYALKVNETQICLRQDVNVDQVTNPVEDDSPDDGDGPGGDDPVDDNNPIDDDIWDLPDDDASQNQGTK